jgi:catechol 2,3-dioxygenase-like lactoylglutathione lyase family enzyme
MSQRIDSLFNQYDRGAIDRRQLLAGLAAMATLSEVASGEEPKPAFEAKSLNHVTLSVSDVQKSKAFYESILGVSTISTQKNGINLGVGDSFIGLYAIKEPPRVNHFCVGLDEYHVQAAAERLKQFGITPRVRQDKPEVYFQDPDGITVQLESKDYRG